MVKNQINALAHGNCEADGLEILTTSSSKPEKPQEDSLEESPFIISRHPQLFNPIGLDYDEAEPDSQPEIHLSTFVEDVAKYIGGFVVAKLKYRKLITCDICLKSLIVPNNSFIAEFSLLTIFKDRGPYLIPTKEVLKICLNSEKIFRASESHFLSEKKNILRSLSFKVLRALGVPFDTTEMDDHILSQHFLDNHRIQLAKLVIEYYFKIRMHHFARLQNKNQNLKQKHSNLAKFSGQ